MTKQQIFFKPGWSHPTMNVLVGKGVTETTEAIKNLEKFVRNHESIYITYKQDDNAAKETADKIKETYKDTKINIDPFRFSFYPTDNSKEKRLENIDAQLKNNNNYSLQIIIGNLEIMEVYSQQQKAPILIDAQANASSSYTN